jgi:phage tail sheath protein FI
VKEFLRLQARETVLIAALPLREDEKSIDQGGDLFRLSLQTRQKRANDRLKAARDAQFKAASEIESAFVQLVYPWLRTRDSGTMRGDLEPPDGALAGMIANLALTRGAWRTLAREPVPWLYAVEPILSRAELDLTKTSGRAPLRDRITIFGPTSSGLRLLSDVTTDDEPLWRPASTVRLMNLLVRAARQAGEQFVFMNNGEALWSRVRHTMNQLLSALWADGALYGATPAEAFEVRCDRSTMTQADIDAGRAIARFAFLAAEPIMRIVVSFTMNEAGQLSIASEETGDLERKAA